MILWSSAKGRRSGKPSRHLIEEAGGDKRRQCPAVRFLHLHNLLIFKEFPSGCGSYCSPDLVHQHPHYTDSTLGFTHRHPFFVFVSGKWAAPLALGGKQNVYKSDTPHANHVQGYATYSITSMGCLGMCSCSDRPKCIYIGLHNHVSILPSFQKWPQHPDQTLAEPLPMCRVSNEWAFLYAQLSRKLKIRIGH